LIPSENFLIPSENFFSFQENKGISTLFDNSNKRTGNTLHVPQYFSLRTLKHFNSIEVKQYAVHLQKRCETEPVS
jgi:hypothetical protein